MTIEVKNLTKRYGPSKAVDDISFEIKEGENKIEYVVEISRTYTDFDNVYKQNGGKI